ncbi:MAG: putative metal-dependent hydrolase [Robiginitalea sp.]|uniref:YfiT family bacillithiol transferase n=2 Tax=Robiginitalea sp. TaxID=1902411 RepID=UPI003C78129D
MRNESFDALRYPIGRFTPPEPITDKELRVWIEALEVFPSRISDLVTTLTEAQLDTPYREGGWTVRQVIHHLSDSHHNSYMRFKWALTEDTPTIKVYDEKAWAALEDAVSGPITLSLEHLKAVHQKLVFLLKSVDAPALKKGFIHPESGFTTLEENVGRYVWHGNHHYAHIERLLQARGWQG